MKTVYLQELPYNPDSSTLFEKIRPLGNPVFLDSSHPFSTQTSTQGRFDILAADPIEKIEYNHLKTNSYNDNVKLFEEIDYTLKQAFGDIQNPSGDIPFCGGAIGYLSYDLGRELENINPDSSPNSDKDSYPETKAYIAFYNWSVIQDHLRQRCLFVGLPQLNTKKREHILSLLRQPANPGEKQFQLAKKFQSNFSAEDYREAFQKIQRYILEGDCYQVNLAQRFSSTFQGDPWQAYLKLRKTASAPFSAFIETDNSAILSLSPERFLSLHGQHVETKPIKGTRPRGNTLETDQLAATELRNSSKDRAENLMIVDLLRNDLGKACKPGSIHVDNLFELESFATVHHLVSTISGELQEKTTAADLLRHCFPGGSITGAPKHRAMQIIDELEPDERNVYCGSIVYISADGRMDSNIAIRTMLCEDNQIHCWGGGGIVADSDWQQEYQETFDKVGPLIAALES